MQRLYKTDTRPAHVCESCGYKTYLHEETPCAVCRKLFRPLRLPAMYCSDACKMKAYRRRKKRGVE